MKKFFKPVVYAAAVALVSAGCAKSEDQTDNHKGNDKSTFVEFYADVVKKDGSRANIEVGEGAFTGAWEESDMLAIVPTVPGASQHSGAHKFGYSATHQSFRGELPSSATGRWEYMAFYPHTEITGTIANIPFGNLRVQNGNSFNSAFDALVADCVVCENSEPGKTENGEKVSFDLKRLTSILNFKVTGAGADKVKYLRLSTGSNEPLSAASLDFDLKDGNPAALNADDQSDVIVVGFESGTAPSANNIDALINVPAGTYEDLVFEVITETGQIGSATITRGPAKPLVAGSLYKKEITDMTFNAIPAPAFEWENEDINAIHDITLEGEYLTYEAAISIAAEGGIAGLDVHITSDFLNALGITTLDLFNETEIPGLGISYEDLLLDCKTGIQYKKSTIFDITGLVPMIIAGQVMIPGGGYSAPGSIHTFEIKVTDLAGQVTEQALKFRVPYTGPAAAYNYDADLWANTASFELVNIPDGAQSVSVSYKKSTETGWQAATISGNTATISPEWDDNLTVAPANSPNTVLPYSRIKAGTGVFANSTYDYKLTIDGTDYSGQFTTTTDQTIPDGNMENGSLPCFTVTGSGTSTFWGSGNNDQTKTLCSQATNGGNKYAALQSKAVLVVMAAGNLFTGTFTYKAETLGGTGTVKFGQRYDWDARPTALRVNYSSKVDNVDFNVLGGPLAKKDPDKARIFVAIIDWSEQHSVGSTYALGGKNNGCTGGWDPEKTTSLTEGAIIGYGSMWIDKGTTDWSTVNIPINFYDTTAKPTEGNYSIVISCAANAYGDYFNGCSSNYLYVDDFEWVY